MKRIYFAIVFLLIAFGVGALEYGVISSGCDSFNERLDTAEEMLESGRYTEAQELCRQTAEDFDRYSENGLYYFYNHDNTKEVGESLSKLGEYIRLGKIDDFVVHKKLIQKRLLAIKDKEHITLKNII